MSASQTKVHPMMKQLMECDKRMASNVKSAKQKQVMMMDCNASSNTLTTHNTATTTPSMTDFSCSKSTNSRRSNKSNTSRRSEISEISQRSDSQRQIDQISATPATTSPTVIPPQKKSAISDVALHWRSLLLFFVTLHWKSLLLLTTGAGLVGQRVCSQRAASREAALSLFQQQAGQILEETTRSILTTVDVFQGFGTSIQQIAQFSDQAWPYVTIPHWEQRATPILQYAKADSIILAPLVDPRQWDTFYDYTSSLHEEKLHWKYHFQSLFVPWQKAPPSKEGSAQNLREWYVDPAAAQIMDTIPTMTHPAVLLRHSVNASFDYLFQPIVIGGGDASSGQGNFLSKIFQSKEEKEKQQALQKKRAQGVVVGLVAAQVRLEKHIELSLSQVPLLVPNPTTKKRDRRPIRFVAVLEDNCGTQNSFLIEAAPDKTARGRRTAAGITATMKSRATFLGVGDYHDESYNDFEVASDSISFAGTKEKSTDAAAATSASNNHGGCLPTGIRIHLYPTAQMVGATFL